MDNDERRKLKELMKEKEKSDAPLQWMYRENKPDDEEFLLGKRIDKIGEEEESKEDAYGALFSERIQHNIQKDAQAKMREDPLFAIRQKEEDAKRRLLENPVKMKRLQKAIEREKEVKSKKSKKKKHRKKSSDSDSDDDLMSQYLNIVNAKRKGPSSDKRDKKSDFKRSKLREGTPEQGDRNRWREKQRDRTPEESDRNKWRGKQRERTFEDNSMSKWRGRSKERSPGRIDRNNWRSNKDMGRNEKIRERDRSYDQEDRVYSVDNRSYNREGERRTREYKHDTCKYNRNERYQESDAYRSDKSEKYKYRKMKQRADQSSSSYSDSEQEERKPRSAKRKEKSNGSGARYGYEDKSINKNTVAQSDDAAKRLRRQVSSSSSSSSSEVEDRNMVTKVTEKHRYAKKSSSSSNDSDSDKKSDSKTDRRKNTRDANEQLQRRHDSSSDSSSDERSTNTRNAKNNRNYNESDDDRAEKPKAYGLVILNSDGAPTPKQIKSRKYRRSSSSSLSPPRKVAAKKRSKSRSPQRQPKRKLTEEEKQKRLAEMMDNAKWREDQRHSNVKRYAHEDKREEDDIAKNYDKTGSSEFVNPLMSRHAESSSVEDRIRRNRNNILRTTADMDRGFSKR